MVKIIRADKKIDCEHLLGTFCTEDLYDTIIDSDTDFYVPSSTLGESVLTDIDIGFKFRKNWFSSEDQKNAYDGLHQASAQTNNRGLAAGNELQAAPDTHRQKVTEEEFEILYYLNSLKESLFDRDLKLEIEKIKKKHKEIGVVFTKNVWLGYVSKNFNFDKYIDSLLDKDIKFIVESTTEILEVSISTTKYANMVNSGIAGWYDRYSRIPYGRPTAYTKNNLEIFKKSYKFLQTLSSAFKELLPIRYSNQKNAIDTIDKEFIIPDTVFTTLTVNKTFQTAFHRDAGDYTKGLSNLLVLTNGNTYSGGFLVLPEYRVAINIRPGDLLLINNHEIIHGNTEIILESEASERVSLVCYLREGMLKLGRKEYEDYRFEFVELRRNNKEHKYHVRNWNGVSNSMWGDNKDSDLSEAVEWKEFLLSKPNGEKYLKDYHPWLINTETNLSEFF